VRTFSKSLLTSRLHQDLDLKNTNTSEGYYRKINQDLAGNVILDEGLMKKYQRQNFVLLGIGRAISRKIKLSYTETYLKITAPLPLMIYEQ
jgi:hypothetical protein